MFLFSLIFDINQHTPTVREIISTNSALGKTKGNKDVVKYINGKKKIDIIINLFINVFIQS